MGSLASSACWAAQQCIDELRRIAEIDPEKFISRNYFRVHSRIAESVWSRHFGTFSEYKRQANVQLSRHQHQHERNIAKHASVDHYRKLGASREDWGDKYVRESSGRFKTLLVASDLHDKEIDPFFLRVLIDTAKRAQPDVIVLNGDIFDLPEFGKYTIEDREQELLVAGWTHKDAIEALTDIDDILGYDMTQGWST